MNFLYFAIAYINRAICSPTMPSKYKMTIHGKTLVVQGLYIIAASVIRNRVYKARVRNEV